MLDFASLQLTSAPLPSVCVSVLDAGTEGSQLNLEVEGDYIYDSQI